MSDVATPPTDYLHRVGRLIRDARKHRGLTQAQLGAASGTSQSAINRIEQGNQNLSLELLSRISDALDSEIVSLGHSGPMHLRVIGGTRLSGSITVKTSKNAGVALLCAALINKGTTVLRKVARDRGSQPYSRGAWQHRRSLALAEFRQRPGNRTADAAGSVYIGRRSGAANPKHDHVLRAAHA